ncbi:MAG: putative Na+/H+ antiporter [Bacteriovorax sp.]
MTPSTTEVLSTVLFFVAILHTFLVSKFEVIAHRYPKNSIPHNFWHLFAEVEIVFGFWAMVFLVLFAFIGGKTQSLLYLESLDFTEPAFVFVIMCLAATRPVIHLAEKLILFCSKALPLPERQAYYVSALIIGPILGSFITEPAAMTVTALILLNSVYRESVSLKFKYATLGLLFVNISIGGTLTHFAAPPVLMVAHKWNWKGLFMLGHFGYKAFIAIVFSTALYARRFNKELQGSLVKKEVSGDRHKEDYLIPKKWKIFVHLIFLFCVVYSAHHPAVFIALFLCFLAFAAVTEKYQDPLKLKESLRVAFFLSGLITLGSMQAWWLKDLLLKMNELVLFFGASALTSITDNAALTYLGSLANLSESSRYALVAGAVSGGGLTVIANAPNPAGFGILRESFGHEGISPLRLFLWAIIPTSIGIICFLFLPSL